MTEATEAVEASTPLEQRTKINLSRFDQRLAKKHYFLEQTQAEMLRLILSNPYFGNERIPRVRAVRLTGPAGSGKTFLGETTTHVMTDSTGVKHRKFYFQATKNMAEDEMFFGLMPGDEGNFERFDGVLLETAHASKKGPVVLVLDEWDKARPQADAMLLDFLQSGRISHPACRINGRSENLIVFVCTNDEREISEPLQRRCAALELGHPPVDIMEKILRKECPESGFVEHALKVYAQTIKASLSKPATAQELVQMIEALEDIEDPTELTFTSILNTFILKTPPDRKLFSDWCEKNNAVSLTDLAKGIQEAAPKRAYTAFDPNKENYRAVAVTELEDNSKLVTPIRVWNRGYPEAEVARKGHAMFEADKLPQAVAHIPAVTRDPEKWKVVDNAAVSFEPLKNLDGYATILGMNLRDGVVGTVVFTMDYPLNPPGGFSIWAVAKMAEQLYVYDENCARGTLTLKDAEQHKFRVWFEVRKQRLEIIISTDGKTLDLRRAINHLLGNEYTNWWLGEQDPNSNFWFSSRAYADGEPRTHGLFRINMTKLPEDVSEELKKRNRVRSLHLKKLIQQKV